MPPLLARILNKLRTQCFKRGKISENRKASEKGWKEKLPRKYEDINEKIDADKNLKSEEVVRLMREPLFWGNYEDVESNIEEEKIYPKVFRIIIQKFSEEGIIDFHEDLIHPEIQPQDYNRKLEPMGYVNAPYKNPSSLFGVRESILAYVIFEDKGFMFDGEMIYDFEEDYEKLLNAALNFSKGLSEYEAKVVSEGHKSGDKVKAKIESDEKTYSYEFEQVGDWVTDKALYPLLVAMKYETGEEILLRTGTDGKLIILDSSNMKILAQQLNLETRVLTKPVDY